MSELRGACIFGQSGGPTSVINSSAAGVFTEALRQDCITKVYGAAHGIRGILDEVFYDMGEEDPYELELLKTTPSSALGSVRYKLKDVEVDDTDYKRILEVFQKYDIRYFFYNGGNDSMDTCNKISKYLQKSGYECRVMGVPKTVDNDLFGTDHTPGFGSAAKFVATATMEVFLDARVYDIGMVTIIETMGRNAGWITASSALAASKGCGPDLIYLPERALDLNQFIDDVKAVYDRTGKVIAVVSEGTKTPDGRYIPELNQDSLHVDAFGHKQLSGVAVFLANEVKNRIGCKVRGIEYSLLQRSAAHCASLTDVNESFLAGQTAVRSAVCGKSDFMVAFERAESSHYVCNTKLVELSKVANFEKVVPDEWITKDGNFVTEDFVRYAMPLIQGESAPPMEDSLPRFARLKKVRVPQL